MPCLFAEEATEFIAGAQKPFFLYFAPNEIHSPHHPTKPVRGSSEAGIYGDVVHDLDLLVGRIIDAVKQKGAWENTIFLFTSDNGGVMTRDTLKAGHHANGTPQSQNSDIWEGGHRVPFIVRWPGRVVAGSACSKVADSKLQKLFLCPQLLSVLLMHPNERFELSSTFLRP